MIAGGFFLALGLPGKKIGNDEEPAPRDTQQLPQN